MPQDLTDYFANIGSLIASQQQAITRTYVDQVVPCHLASKGLKELKGWYKCYICFM